MEPLYFEADLRLKLRPDTDHLPSDGIMLSTGVTVTLVAPDDSMASINPTRHELAVLLR